MQFAPATVEQIKHPLSAEERAYVQTYHGFLMDNAPEDLHALMATAG